MTSPRAGAPGDARRNLELKVRVTAEDLDAIRATLVAATGAEPEVQWQVDRYFQVPAGRLKLRVITYHTGMSRAELIGYRRPDVRGSRWSSYRITPLPAEQAESLAGTLAQVLPVLVEVRKRREIVIVGATRVHLDAVDGLGAFVELETVIGSQDDEHATREHREVIDRLGLDAWPVEAGSYSDLLLAGAHLHET